MSFCPDAGLQAAFHAAREEFEVLLGAAVHALHARLDAEVHVPDALHASPSKTSDASGMLVGFDVPLDIQQSVERVVAVGLLIHVVDWSFRSFLLLGQSIAHLLSLLSG